MPAMLGFEMWKIDPFQFKFQPQYSVIPHKLLQLEDYY